jgi:hypothetical protein
MKLKVENGGHLSYGDMMFILDKYRSTGFNCLTRRNLRYRLDLMDGLMVSETQFPVQEIMTLDLDEMSPITADSNQQHVSQTITMHQKNKSSYLQLLKTSTTTVATQMKEIIDKNGGKILPPNVLNNLITNVETKVGLAPGSIKPTTVRARLYRNNIEGVHNQHVPILDVLEPLVVQWCLKMAEIGMSLDRLNVIELVNDLIKNTDFENKIRT